MTESMAQPLLEHALAVSCRLWLLACCSWIMALCLGVCIFRHIRLRVMTFTGYLWKCYSGHDTALYTLCCTSVCALMAVTLTVEGGET